MSSQVQQEDEITTRSSPFDELCPLNEDRIKAVVTILESLINDLENKRELNLGISKDSLAVLFHLWARKEDDDFVTHLRELRQVLSKGDLYEINYFFVEKLGEELQGFAKQNNVQFHSINDFIKQLPIFLAMIQNEQKSSTPRWIPFGGLSLDLLPNWFLGLRSKINS